MTKIELLEMLVELAKKYKGDAAESVARNKHMNSATGDKLNQADIDALLVDFINFVGIKQGIDFGLYAKDLDA